ncbi:hypothetical protein [Commensalibacter oyaizuii]|uniref:Uncharacterized protein n=1 Tax=Commensalibacter oyaizuii TaxID=3043873 RepID=A0ABT6Q4L7_9PROT|nr:hypothetical protein [Commensalibacter sp. TBRC 16381]MDI2091439.1 hypothetical protein [Commensalibacter sp. TBRC 16381]
MKEKIFEIKGHDGIIQIERKSGTSSSHVEVHFYYRNNDIVFIYKDIDEHDTWSFLYFQQDLRRLIANSPYLYLKEPPNQKSDSDSWFKKLLKDPLPFLFEYPLKDMKDSCAWICQDPYAYFEIKKLKNSSDYLIEFDFPDPYPVSPPDGNEILFSGALLVSEEALVSFYQELELN